MRVTPVAFIAVAALAAAYFIWPTQAVDTAQTATGTDLVEVLLPEELPETAKLGKRAFEAKCAACHGLNGAGNADAGPPLIHIIYEPSHHGDEAFQRAAATGVRAHHWKFGDMPPVDGITRGEVASIVAYIRKVQQANGIF